MSRILVLALFLGCGMSVPSPGETPGVTDARYANAITTSREILLKRAATLPGLAAAVAVDGKIVWTSGFGWADIAAKKPMSADAAARIYSVNKPLTAALAFRLAERGVIDLDKPIRADGITLAQLLSHTSGIRHYRDGEWLRVSSKPCASTSEALAPFVNDPLLFKPGTREEYSSFGYVLASNVLENAAKKPFPELMRDEMGVSPRPPGTTFYEPARFGRVRVARAVDNSCKFGAGSLVATAPDLASFGAALLDGRIVNAESLRKMTEGEGDFAMGFGTGKDDILGPYAAQSGAAIGGMSYLLLVPRARIVVAIVANMEGDRFGNDARAIARAFQKH
ncbi:MAG TPA: serine hydrolase domain-containing protein [Thermoanaerobaculia bacterium]|nr:serine hydrolase domain-containing protein [Thermoanaerobaculia bacterium]